MKNIIKGFWILVVLMLFPLMSNCNLWEHGVAIKGKVINRDDYKHVGSFIQLVPLDTKKMEVTGFTVVRDINNNILEIEYVSDFPKLDIPPDDKFEYRIDNLQPGRYIMVMQHLMSQNKPSGFYGHGPWLSRPFGKANGKIIVIDISEKDKPAYSVNLGEVLISFKESDRFIITEFDEVALINP